MLKGMLLRAAGSQRLKREITRNRLSRAVAERFIAGATLDEAVRVAHEVNEFGAAVALDHLGENTTAASQARAAAAAYVDALDRAETGGLDASVSVKLSALGLDVAEPLALEGATAVAGRAAEVGAVVEIDMEAHEYVEPTLRVLEKLHGSYDNLAVCLQAYLFRTADDLEQLIAWGIPVRLVKGAYAEPPDVAYQDKANVDGAYARLLARLLEAGTYPKIATHDGGLVRLNKELAARAGRDPTTFEFQMLYGVRRDLQRGVLAEGYRLRVYLPYGDEWYPYFMRRLAERPANLYFFLSNLVRR